MTNEEWLARKKKSEELGKLSVQAGPGKKDKNVPDVDYGEIEVKDETKDLLERVIKASYKKEGVTSEDEKILKQVDIKLSKEDYSNAFKNFAKDMSGKLMTKEDLMDKWETQLNYLAKDLGVIDKFDDATLRKILKDQTPVSEQRKLTTLGAFQQGAYNLVEGFQYAGIAAKAAIKGDKSIYLDKAGMDDKSNWTDIMRDLVWMGDTGSTTGGKMFFADIITTVTGPLMAAGRVAVSGIGKAAIKSGGKTVVKNVTKNLTKQEALALVKSGAEIELTGIGKMWTSQSINKAAKELADKEIKAAGKATTGLPNSLIQEKKVELIYNGLNGEARAKSVLSNLALGALDAVNIPLSTRPREIWKLMSGYGLPVMANAGEGMAAAAEIFGRPGDVVSKLYAKSYLTAYEKQLAAEFEEITGANPLSEGFTLSEEWDAYKNSKISNAGFSTILLGEKESSSGKFWNSALESIVNMGGMMLSTKALHGGVGFAADKMKLTGVADITKQITKLREEKYKNLDKTNIEQFVKEVESLDFKTGGVEDYKLINRADTLISNIVRESNVLAKTDPVVASLRDELVALINSDKEIPKDQLAQKLEEIKLTTKKLGNHLDVDASSMNLIPSMTELKKISEYFQKVEETNTFKSRLTLSLLRNTAKGSSIETRNVLGGMTTAEAIAGGYSSLSKYAVERVLSYNDMAKNIAEQKAIEVRQTRLMSDLIVASKDGIKLSGLLPQIKDGVSQIVEANIKNSPQIIKDAVFAEGVTKVFSAYLTMDNSAVKGIQDFKTFSTDILSKTFGTSIVSKLDPKTKAGEFVSEKTTVEDVRKVINKMASDPESIFNPNTVAGTTFLEKYKTLNGETKAKLNQIADSIQKASTDFYVKSFEAQKIQKEIDIIKNLGIIPPQFRDGSYFFNNKEYKTEAGVKNAVKKEATNKAISVSNEAMKDPNYVNNVLTKEEVSKIVDENFQGLIDQDKKQAKILNDHLPYIQDMFLNVYGLKTADSIYKDIETKQAEVDKVEVDGDEAGVAEASTNKYVETLHSAASKKAVINPANIKVGTITKISERLNIIRARDFSVEEGSKIKESQKAKKFLSDETKAKKQKAISFSESLKQEYGIITGIISDIQRELASKSLTEAEKNIMNKRLKVLTTSKAELASRFGLDPDSDLSKILTSVSDDVKAVEYIKAVEAEIASIKNVTSELESLRLSEEQALASISKTDEKIKGIDKQIELKNAEIEKYNTEIEKLNSQADIILEEISDNPFKKSNLVEIAKNSESPKVFFDNLRLAWKESFKEAMPLELVPKNPWPVYSVLKQTKYTYADGTPKKFLNINLSQDDNSKTDFSFRSRVSESPESPDGRTRNVELVESSLDRIADKKGYKVVEVGAITKNGKTTNISDLASRFLEDEATLSKYAETIPAAKNLSDKVDIEVAIMIAKKAQIGAITNSTEMAVALANINNSYEVNGNKYIQLANKNFFEYAGKASQGSIDTGVILNPRFVNLIYEKFVKPIRTEASMKGYTLLGSINEEGKRLFFTETKNGNSDATLKSFYEDVLMISSKKLDAKDISGKELKRIKVISSNDPHPEVEGLKAEYANAGVNRINENGEFRFKAIRVSDEDYNKIQLELGGVTKDFVTTDGKVTMTPLAFESIAKMAGNNPKDADMKASMTLEDQQAVVKAKFNKGNEYSFNQSYIKDVLSRMDDLNIYDINGKINMSAVNSAFDFIIPDSTFKILGEPKAKYGEVFDINPDALSVKRLSSNPKTEVSLAFQAFNILPRNISGDSKSALLYDKMIDEVMKNIAEPTVKEFVDLVNLLRINPTAGLKLLEASDLSKGMALSEDMSKALTDLARDGFLKKSNIGIFNSHINRILKDKVFKFKVKGTSSILDGIGDYPELLKHINNNLDKFKGVTDKNFLILDPASHNKSNFAVDENGRAEAISYRYPINRPGNISINKIIWLDELPKELQPSLGHGALLNMFDVAMLKDGDFDIDTINIVYDKRLGPDTKNYLKHIANNKELQVGISVKPGEMIESKDVINNMFNAGEGIKDKDRFGMERAMAPEINRIRDLNKILSKHNEFELNDSIDFILDQNKKTGDILSERKQINLANGNEKLGASFLERFMAIESFKELNKIILSNSAEMEASKYANEKILNGNSLPENNDTYRAFKKLNESFAKEIAPKYKTERIHKFKFQSYRASDYEVVEKNGKFFIETESDVKFGDNRLNNKPFLNELKDQLIGKINTEIKDVPGKNQELIKSLNAKKSIVLGIINERIELVDTVLSRVAKEKKDIIKKYENKLIREIGPKLNIDPERELVERAIMSQPFGSTKDYDGYKGVASDIVSSEIHSEYNKYLSEKYLESNLSENLGIKMDPEKINEIRMRGNDLEEALKNTESEAEKMKLQSEYDQFVKEVTEETIKSARPSDRPLTLDDLNDTGRLGGLFKEIIFENKKDLIASRRGMSTVYRVSDVRKIKSNIDVILTSGDLAHLNRNKESLLKVAHNLNQEVFNLVKNTEKFEDLLKNEQDANKKKSYQRTIIDNKKAIDLKKDELNNAVAHLMSAHIVESSSLVKTIGAVADSSLKLEMANESLIADKNRSASAAKTRGQSLIVDRENLRELEGRQAMIIGSISEIQKLNKETILRLKNIGSEDGKARLLDEMRDEYQKIMQKNSLKLLMDTSQNIAKQNKTSFLRDFDAKKEADKHNVETNREIAKLYQLEPADFLSNLFGATTKIYKNLSVGIAAGRALIETANAFLIWAPEKLKYITHAKKYKTLLEGEFGNAKDFKYPDPGKFDGTIYDDFFNKSIEHLRPEERNNVLRGITEKTSKLAGIASSAVNFLPSKFAQDFYTSEFNKLLYEEVYKKTPGKKQKDFLLKDPSKLNSIERNQYYRTIEFLKQKAEYVTKQNFFNYEINPLIAHKMEKVMPFSNFLFSGLRLFKNHPRTILGMNAIFSSIVNNYGEETQYVEYDENGDPVRRDYGKRLRIPLLGSYAGASFNPYRLLQFSPTDSFTKLTPALSILGGDYDWRVKKFMDGESSGLEFALGTLSPSISQVVTGIVENDYEKRFSGIAYLATGIATKSSAHAKIANDFYIKQDFDSVLNAPEDVRKHLYDSYNKKNKNKFLDDDVIKAQKAAKELGLLDDGGMEYRMGVPSTKASTKQAIILKSQLLHLAQNGIKDPLVDPAVYNEEAKYMFEFVKWAVGDGFADNERDPEWFKKVDQFVEAGHLENLARINPNYAKAMRHFAVDNREYYENLDKYRNIAYGKGATAAEKEKAQAALIALKYELVSPNRSLEGKIKEILDGEIQFIVDEKTGMPLMTKEREAEINYRGHYVAKYEEAISEHLLYKDLYDFYVGMAVRAKESKDKTKENYAWNEVNRYKGLVNQSFRVLKEEHEVDAEIYAIKRLKSGLTPPEIKEKGYSLTAPTSGYVEKKKSSLNEFYNNLVNDRVNFLKNTDLKWSQLSNREKSVFMSLNNGKTVNQAREELQAEAGMHEGLIDINSDFKPGNKINNIIKELYD